jgi:hypothetical protein
MPMTQLSYSAKGESSRVIITAMADQLKVYINIATIKAGFVNLALQQRYIEIIIINPR